MAENRQIREFDEIIHGTTASSNVKMTDHILLQHEDVSGNVNTFNKFTVGQTMCQPVAVTPNSTPSGGAYTATCSNFPDFAISYTDKNSNTHSLIGMKVRVIFTTGITYGSTTANPPTYPTLNINGTGALPLLAQGMTMGAGAASAGQSLELTLIPYGNSLAWDADTNVRERGYNYTVYVDGTKRVDDVEDGNLNLVTSNAVFDHMKKFHLGYENNTIPKYLKLLTIQKGNRYGIGLTSFIITGINGYGSKQAILMCSVNSRGPKVEVYSVVPMVDSGTENLMYTEDDNNYYLFLKLSEYHSYIDIMILEEFLGEYITWNLTYQSSISNETSIKNINDVSDQITVINDSEAEVYFKSYGKIGIFSIHAKQALTAKSINISSFNINMMSSEYKSCLSWGASDFRGEAYIPSNNTMYIASSGQGNCSLTVFLQ